MPRRGAVEWRESWIERWRLLLGGALALFGLAEIGLYFYFSSAAPRISEWRALRSSVEELADDHTLIVTSPEWAEPNARLALGDGLMPLAHVARSDVTGFERAVEISALGESSEELAGWQQADERRVGPFLLRTWLNPQVRPVLYDFLEHLEPPHASVSVLGKAEAEACNFTTAAKVTNGDLHGHPTFPRSRFACRGGEWFFVGLTVIEDQRYRPRRCMWAHPASRGALAMRFATVPLGNVIRGYGGLSYFFERESRGTPIELSVYVAGEPMGSWQHKDGEGWKPFEFSTSRFAGQVQPVEFRIRSKKAWRREFCFQADVR